MMRFKGRFSVCKISPAYEVAIKGHNTIAQREKLDRNFLIHLTETNKEKDPMVQGSNKMRWRQK